jgi:ribonuclease PH
VEIQRLIGRTFRSVVDLTRFPGKTVWIDCDVLQADGGTRTAAITGACVAFRAAVKRWKETGVIAEDPMVDRVAAVSLGIVDGTILLDLDYPEDSRADVDMNLVMTRTGNLVEVQISSEKNVFSREQMDTLLDLGRRGIEQLAVLQDRYLGEGGPGT